MSEDDLRPAAEWAARLARPLQMQRILRDGAPYLDRYFVAGYPRVRGATASVYLHHFRASDASDQVHSHPWAWSVSLILSGGYREHRCLPDGQQIVRLYHPGDLNVLRAHDRHRIDLLGAECWTLFLAGAYEKPWNFQPIC
jgi:hypothetical protein